MRSGGVGWGAGAWDWAGVVDSARFGVLVSGAKEWVLCFLGDGATRE